MYSVAVNFPANIMKGMNADLLGRPHHLWKRQRKIYRQISYMRRTKSQTFFSSRLAVVFAQSIDVMY